MLLQPNIQRKRGRRWLFFLESPDQHLPCTFYICKAIFKERPKLNSQIACSYGLGFPGDSDGRESICSSGDPCLIPRSGRSSGEGNGNPLQYSCLENPKDRGAWRATVHGVAESDMSERLSMSGIALRYQVSEPQFPILSNRNKNTSGI